MKFLLFSILVKRLPNLFISMLISILASKILYYSVKYLMIKTAIMNADLVATPFAFQIGTAVILSVYVYIRLVGSRRVGE